MTGYDVTYEQDEAGLWVGTAHGIEGVHTRGRSVSEAQERMKEALALVDGFEKPLKTNASRHGTFDPNCSCGINRNNCIHHRD